MGSKRITTAAAVAVLLTCIPAGAASGASTLLSGYGGPGAGNQAILGSTLVGGSGKGAGGGGAGSQSVSSASPASIALPQGAATGTSPRRSQPAVPRGTKSSGAGNASKSSAPAYTPTTVSSDRAGGGKGLGLTGGDVVYIVLAFGALALTAAITRRFARRPGGAGRTQ
ncbi:MAG: hypothetical protein QOK19_23 [Solirubrobacteraceae bacterium]|nr:hypothetical protein [Solirubrobacteraceae bacterium]